MSKSFAINTVACIAVLFIFGCTNEPAEFSQGKVTTTTINIEVDAPTESESTESNNPNAETSNPANQAGESKLNTLLDGFDSASSENFNPDDFDIETEANPDGKTANESNEPDASAPADATTATDANSSETTTDQPKSTETPAGVQPGADPMAKTEIEVVSKSEVRLCSKLAGVNPEDVILQQPTSIKSGSVLAIKINGNGADVVLNLAGDAKASLQGICIFSAGNQPKFSARIGLKVENFLYVARGNQGTGAVTVEGNGSLIAAVVSLSGKGQTFHIKSNGKPECASIFAFVKDGGFTCE